MYRDPKLGKPERGFPRKKTCEARKPLRMRAVLSLPSRARPEEKEQRGGRI